MSIVIRCFLLWLTLSGAAWSGDLIVSRGLLEDKAGTLTLSDVARADFQPLGDVMAKGYSDSVFWLRIAMRAPAAPGPVELLVRPTFLDDVRLYEPDGAGGWKEHVSGDRHGYGERERAAVTLGFVVHPHAEETTYYLRLQTTSTSLLHVEGLEPQEAHFKDLRLLLLHGAFFAVMLWIVMWAAHDYITYRQGLSLLFALYGISHILYILALNGYLMPLMPSSHPEWADTLTSVFVAAAVFFSLPFLYGLCRLYEVPRGLQVIVMAIMLVFPLALVLVFAGHTRLAMQINTQAALTTSLLLPVVAWMARKDAVPSRRVFRIAFTSQTVILLMSQTSVQGWGRTEVWRLDNPLAHVLLSALLMFYVMSQRTRLLFKERQEASLQLNLVQQVLQMEQQHQNEQSRFMAMLVHELKMPLSVMRTVLGLEHASEKAKRHAQKALQDMNALVDRCRQTDQLEHSLWIPKLRACCLSSLLEDVRQASEDPARFVMELGTVPDIHSDPQLLQVILGNLMDNAIKYSPPGSPIRIRLDRDPASGNPMVRLALENQPGAAGLPDPDRLFDKYYRSPRAHGKTGSGLGLYLVRGFAELLGGKIEYEAVAGNARFTLLLP